MPAASTKQDMDLSSGLSVIRDVDADGTAENDLNTGAAVLYLVSIDNTANAAQKVYFKIWDATGPTVGVTAPDMIIPVPGGATVSLAILEGLSMATGVSCACVTAGGTAGTVSPTSDVISVIVLS